MNSDHYIFRYLNMLRFDPVHLWPGIKRSLRYLMETEVHVFGFSIAANVLLSFFPFMVVMVALCRHVLGWNEAELAIYAAMRDVFPGELGQYIPLRIRQIANERGPIQWGSLLVLFFTANGIFEPLEVALNKAFGIGQNRSFVRNQIISMGLILLCGSLALVSIVFTAFNQTWMKWLFGTDSWILGFLTGAVLKMAAIPMTMLSLFLVYWLLPNGRVPLERIIPAAIVVGLLIEVYKYLIVLTWPWLRGKLYHEYGVFYVSVAIILWSFIGSHILLAGAEWAGRTTTGAGSPGARPRQVE